MVLTFFRASDKIWQLLLRIANKEGEELSAFAITCATRWGSYHATINALLKNKPILKVASAQGVITNLLVKRLIDDEAW
jgi:hypothetical protein